MKMIRIVHPETGTGPYMSQGKVRNPNDDYDVFSLYKLSHDSMHSPEPSRDELLVKNYLATHLQQIRLDVSSYLFGFTGLDQAFKWFGSSNILKMMHWYAFELQVRDVPDHCAVEGDSQMMAYEAAWNEAPILKKLTVDEVEDYARKLRRK